MQPIPPINIDINIGEEKFTRNINEDLNVSEDDLDECLSKQAALYAYYHLRFHQANELKNFAELEYENTLNEAIKIARDTLIDSKNRVTDKQVMAIVNSSPEVLKSRKKFLNLSSQRDYLYSLVKALEHKKDTIITLAYKKKAEIEALIHRTI